MATTITGSVNSISRATIKNSMGLGSSFNGIPTITFSRSFTSTELTKAYFVSLTVTTTPTVLDLTALTDAFGAALSFTTVRHLAVWHKGTTGNVAVGGGTAPVISALPALVGYTAANSSSNGACHQITTTIAVATLTKNLTITASAGSIAVDLLILGA